MLIRLDNESFLFRLGEKGGKKFKLVKVINRISDVKSLLFDNRTNRFKMPVGVICGTSFTGLRLKLRAEC